MVCAAEYITEGCITSRNLGTPSKTHILLNLLITFAIINNRETEEVPHLKLHQLIEEK